MSAALNIVHLQGADLSGKESLTLLVGAENQVAKRIAVQASDALNDTDGHSF